ncbi:MAG: hypothetical protein ACE5H0_09475 [Bacteroidota bacterium]
MRKRNIQVDRKRSQKKSVPARLNLDAWLARQTDVGLASRARTPDVLSADDVRKSSVGTSMTRAKILAESFWPSVLTTPMMRNVAQ